MASIQQSENAAPKPIWPPIREMLDAAGIPREAVILPGDDTLAFEGALSVTANGGSWTLDTTDYGQRRILRRVESEEDAADALLLYLRVSLPPRQPIDPEEEERLLAWAAPHLLDIASRAQNGLLIDVPAGILLDRIGALDGFLLYPQGTSVEARSLPPTAMTQPLRRFLTAGSIRMNVSVTPPWFGRPGGGLRFAISDPTLGLRDLVASGSLRHLS